MCGGDRPGGELSAGNFVNPTLFADVDNSMTIAQEEIFGPVLALVPFASRTKRCGSPTTRRTGWARRCRRGDVKRALRVARAVRAGTFGINGYTVMPNAPFGGYKSSGIGREGGREGIDAFLETKTVCIDLSGE